MLFNAETVLRMEKQMRKVGRDTGRIERVVRQISRNLEGSMLAGSNVGVVQRQMGTKRIIDGLTRPTMRNLQTHTGGKTIADWAARALQIPEIRQRPLQAFAATGVFSPTIPEVTRDAWRPVLMRAFQGTKLATQPNACQMLSEIILKIRQPDVSVHPAPPLLHTQEMFQKLLVGNLGNQLDRAIRVAMPAYPVQTRVAESFENYRLQAARTMPLLRDGVSSQHPFLLQPLQHKSPTLSPGSSKVEQKTLLTAEPEDVQEPTGTWTVLQPLENAVQRIDNGPLVIRIVFIGIGSLVLGVMVEGIAYFLFYCC